MKILLVYLIFLMKHQVDCSRLIESFLSVKKFSERKIYHNFVSWKLWKFSEWLTFIFLFSLQFDYMTVYKRKIIIIWSLICKYQAPSYLQSNFIAGSKSIPIAWYLILYINQRTAKRWEQAVSSGSYDLCCSVDTISQTIFFGLKIKQAEQRAANLIYCYFRMNIIFN